MGWNKFNLLAVAVSCTLLSWVTNTEAKRGFLLTVPRVLQAGSQETACITFHELESSVNLSLSLLHKDTRESLSTHQETFPKGHGRCFQFEVAVAAASHKVATLSVTGASEDYTFDEEKTVGLQESSLLNFIETDKPIYKPGQTVKFRILSIDQNLKPRLDNVEEVWIENPTGTRIMQWKQVVTQQGLADLQMPLSSEPVLGDWKISAMLGNVKETQIFKVDEYVLPKFEVTVNMPSYVMINAKTIEGEICAKYTYGQPVMGNMQATVCVKQAYHSNLRRPCAIIQKQKIEGCSPFAVNAAEVQLTSNQWSLWEAKLEVVATVEEDGTGMVQNGTAAYANVERLALKINMKDHAQEYFKPGLKFHGKCSVTLPDGKPAGRELIQLSVDHYATKLNFKRNYTTDKNGEFSYSLPKMGNKVSSFSIKAFAVMHQHQSRPGHYSPNEPRAYHYVKKWFSPSGSFLQISPVRDDGVCNSNMRFEVQYTTAPQSDLRMYYQVISRGNIVWSGHKRHLFQHHDTTDSSEEIEVDTAKNVSDKEPEAEGGLKIGDLRIKRSKKSERSSKRKVLPHVADFHINVPVSAEMGPVARLLVYYVREDGETVADSTQFQVAECFNNSVSLQFSDEQVRPGEAVTMEMTAASGSLCAVGVVDKSVLLMGGSKQISSHKVFEGLKRFQLLESKPFLGPDKYCQEKLKGKEKEDGRGRVRMSSMWPSTFYSEFFDSSKAFKDQRILALSDLQIDTRPCKRQDVFLRRSRVFSMALPKKGPMPIDGVPVFSPVKEHSNVPKKNAVDVRTYFPETWLWDLYPVGASGEIEVEQTIPHTITKWVGNGFCTHAEAGLGVASTATVTAFQPFFASFNLPYSVVRGERVPVVISVFNYLSECLVVQLVLKKEPGYKIFGERNTQLCVCGGQSETHTFMVSPRQLGDVNMTVKAESVENSGACGNDLIMSHMLGVRDAVTRKLLVEPEGKEEEYTFSSYDCLEAGKATDYSVKLPLPDDLVPDSARGFVSVMGDVMGPALSGLESLLRLPTGCGEQNMLKFSPNIHILRYLDSTQQTSPAVRAKAVDFMRTGYQRELTYKHDDGSYSAFGNRDPEGSTWLTAFVLRSFAQARPYVFIDEQELKASVDWFRQRQLENGCFPRIGRVLHKDMKGGLAAGGDSFAPLTAYVLASLLEAGLPEEDSAVSDAMLCLESQTIEDSEVYTIALMAYAYTLYDPSSAERADIMDKLRSLAVYEDGTTHWRKPAPPAPTAGENGWFVTPYHQASSADVEMTAYALMAYLGEGKDSINQALPIVRWLTKQRNGEGGFSSTQDTVVALQALSQFASQTYGDGVNATVEVRSLVDTLEKEFFVMPDNSLLLQRTPVSVPNDLSLKLQGHGCVLTQASVRYNVFNVSREESPAFLVKANVRKVTTRKDHCHFRRLDICTKYNMEGEVTNMAVVTIKMVSGWIPIKDSIKELEKQKELGLKRVEVDHNKVNLYFDELDSSYRCINLEVEQDIEVSQAKPALVQVYDYYRPEITTLAEYRIRPYCGTKEELPFLTPEEYDQLPDDPGMITQQRMPVKFPIGGLGGLRGGLDGLRGKKSNESSGGIQVVLEEPLCPSCLLNVPTDLVETFCASKYVYKSEIRRKGALMKLLVDIRTKAQRKKINIFVDREIPEGCECEVLQNTPKKTYALIFSEEDHVMKVKKNIGKLPMTSSITIVKIKDKKHMKEVERQLNRARTKTCGK